MAHTGYCTVAAAFEFPAPCCAASRTIMCIVSMPGNNLGTPPQPKQPTNPQPNPPPPAPHPTGAPAAAAYPPPLPTFPTHQHTLRTLPSQLRGGARGLTRAVTAHSVDAQTRHAARAPKRMGGRGPGSQPHSPLFGDMRGRGGDGRGGRVRGWAKKGDYGTPMAARGRGWTFYGRGRTQKKI